MIHSALARRFPSHRSEHGQATRTLYLVILSDPGQLHHVRERLGAWLSAAGVEDEDTHGAIVLAAHEAVAHGIGLSKAEPPGSAGARTALSSPGPAREIQLWASLAGHCVTIEVDGGSSPWDEQPATAPPDEEGARRLNLVRALVDRVEFTRRNNWTIRLTQSV